MSVSFVVRAGKEKAVAVLRSTAPSTHCPSRQDPLLFFRLPCFASFDINSWASEGGRVSYQPVRHSYVKEDLPLTDRALRQVGQLGNSNTRQGNDTPVEYRNQERL